MSEPISNGPAPLHPGLVLREGAAIFRASFLYCLPLALVFAACQALALAGLGAVQGNPLGWVMYFAAAVGSGASAAAMVVVQSSLHARRQGESAPPPLESLRRGLVAAPSWLATSLVLALVAACVITMVREGGGINAIVAAIIGVPALIFAVSTQLAIPGVATERIGNYAALVRSHRLVWGNWWRTLAVMALALTFAFVATLVAVVFLSLVLGVVLGLASLQAQTPGSLRLVQALVFVLVSVGVLPWWSAMTLALYRQLAAAHAPPGPELTTPPPAAPPDTPAEGPR